MVPVFGKSLSAKVRSASDSLSRCNLCEHRCGADRVSGFGRCGLGSLSNCFKHHISFAEEIEFLPSYMVYFGGCNFRCRYCIQAPLSFEDSTEILSPAAFATDFQSYISRGVKTINLVGGEPSLHAHTILAIAAASAMPIPLILNSNMYMTPETIELFDGVIQLYLADFKFGNDTCASELAGVDRYVDVVTRNLKLVAAQDRLLVRHLLLPGHGECCFEPIAKWMSENLPDTPLHIMATYVPGWRSEIDPQLNGIVPIQEVSAAISLAERLGCKLYGM